jgi:hypothetical protein
MFCPSFIRHILKEKSIADDRHISSIIDQNRTYYCMFHCKLIFKKDTMIVEKWESQMIQYYCMFHCELILKTITMIVERIGKPNDSILLYVPLQINIEDNHHDC